MTGLRGKHIQENNHCMIIERQKDNHEGKPLTPENRSSQSYSNLYFSRLILLHFVII